MKGVWTLGLLTQEPVLAAHLRSLRLCLTLPNKALYFSSWALPFPMQEAQGIRGEGMWP